MIQIIKQNDIILQNRFPESFCYWWCTQDFAPYQIQDKAADSDGLFEIRCRRRISEILNQSRRGLRRNVSDTIDRFTCQRFWVPRRRLSWTFAEDCRNNIELPSSLFSVLRTLGTSLLPSRLLELLIPTAFVKIFAWENQTCKVLR